MNFRYLTASVLVIACIFPVGCSQSGYVDNQGPSASVKSEIDPVCKMSVNPSSAKATHEHHDKTYYFCSEHCKESFKTEPEKYIVEK